MEPDFWQQKWGSGQIGFHEARPHRMLVRHWSALALATGSRVFVPLCGKSNDLLWLRARGHTVVGVELSEIAVTAFFAENALLATRTVRGPFTVFEAPGYILLCGDYSALTPELLGPCDAIYDRAALIALPPPMRRDYAATLTRLASPATAMLLITVHYAAAALSPPPFVVDAAELAGLYGGAWRLDDLGHAAAEVKGHPAEETAFRLRRTGDPSLSPAAPGPLS